MNAGGTLFFVASEPATGTELYRSDGTPEGTLLVGDIVAGPASSNPATLTAAGGLLFFTAATLQIGREMWVLDPNETPAGGDTIRRDHAEGGETALALKAVRGRAGEAAGPVRRIGHPVP